MMFRNLAFLASIGAASAMEVYTAMIMPLSSNYTAEGTMVVMIEEGSTSIFYGGHVMGLESSLDAMMCTAMNGCGLHIHMGMSCESVETQGGHLYETDEDPWLEARHSTTADGVLIEGTWLEIGTNDVNGRVVIVHNEAGERAGCGILQPVVDSFTQLSAMTSPLGDDSMAEAEAFVAGDEMFLCYAGMARGLEANVMSFMSEGGMDCNVANGCGTHMHQGTSCENIDTQGGHWYETEEDPWLMESYLTTTADGMAYFGNCLMVGSATSMAEGRPFIVHDSMGNRVSCGILEARDAMGDAPSPSMGMEPTMMDPTMMEPTMMDPTMMDPTMMDPTMMEPSMMDPTMMEPTMMDPTMMEPSMMDPTMMEPSMMDPTIMDPTMGSSSSAWLYALSQTLALLIAVVVYI